LALTASPFFISPIVRYIDVLRGLFLVKMFTMKGRRLFPPSSCVTWYGHWSMQSPRPSVRSGQPPQKLVRVGSGAGRPDKDRPFFPKTSAQKASVKRRNVRRAKILDGAELVTRTILSATEEQLPRLLSSFHTIDSRVREKALENLAAVNVDLAARFAVRFER